MARQHSRFSHWRLTDRGESLDPEDFDVLGEDSVAHSVVRTATGWSVEVRVMGRVQIDGEEYSWERVVRIPLDRD